MFAQKGATDYSIVGVHLNMLEWHLEKVREEIRRRDDEERRRASPRCLAVLSLDSWCWDLKLISRLPPLNRVTVGTFARRTVVAVCFRRGLRVTPV